MITGSDFWYTIDSDYSILFSKRIVYYPEVS